MHVAPVMTAVGKLKDTESLLWNRNVCTRVVSEGGQGVREGSLYLLTGSRDDRVHKHQTEQ